MATARVVDVDEEPILRHFCLEAECTQVLKWFGEQGHSRPEEFEDRLQLAAALREQGNKLFQASDFEGAMLHTLGALHCADFSQARRCLQTDAQKREVHEHLVRIISNLSIVFLKKSDAYNAARAADLGLEYARRLPAASVDQIRAKLLFRRGLARGQTRDFVDARADLREAARLMPDNREVRHALENCKAFEREDRGAPDDKWRGLLTESPKKVQQSKRRDRCWRQVRTGTHKVFAGMRNPESLRAAAKVLAVVLLGPVMSKVTRMVMARVVLRLCAPAPLTHPPTSTSYSHAMAPADVQAQRRPSSTVTFLVGGRSFVVLREPTLSLHEGSLLKQLADDSSDAEPVGGEGAQSAPIHVEANPEYFQYILDYHMHRKIYVPYTISKEGLINAARKLGLTVAHDDIVQDMPPLGQVAKLMKQATCLAEQTLPSPAPGAKSSILAREICEFVLHHIKARADVLKVKVTKQELVAHKDPDFSPVFDYLVKGVTSTQLLGSLRPWAGQHGYTVTLEQEQWVAARDDAAKRIKVRTCTERLASDFALDAALKCKFEALP